MIRSYLKIAWRNLIKYKGFTLIKVLGLSVGLMCCILIMLFVKNEWSYDQFHSKSDRIYRMWQEEEYEDQTFVNTITPIIMGPTLEDHIPEIEETCRLIDMNPIVSLGENDFTEDVLIVDPSFFKIFDFELVKGNRKNPFPTQNTVILSEATAEKFFGKTPAIGKNIEIELNDEKRPFTIGGIVKDAPEASSIKFNMLIPSGNINTVYSKNAQTSWFNIFAETYVLLKKGAATSSVSSKFPGMMKQALGENYTEGGFRLHLQPVTDIHLNNELPKGIQPTSNPKYSYILATIGFIILIVACANFIILAVGQSSRRAREVGVRKVMGAGRTQLVKQFMGEAVIITFASLLISIILSFLLLKPFNTIIQRNLEISLSFNFVIFCLGLAILVALIAGFYPALVLSRFSPIKVLKGKVTEESGSGYLRKGLIIGQFAASIAMIICTIVIGEQINYFRNKDLGYTKDQVIVVPTNLSRDEGMKVAERYRNELLTHPQVSDASISLYSFAENSWINLGFTNEKKEYKTFQYNAVDPNFITTMDIELGEGRNFDPHMTSDITNAAIVNEAFIKSFGLENPVGKKLPGKFTQQIIGVVKDFNYQSLHNQVAPLVLTIQPDSIFRKTENINVEYSPEPRVSVRLSGGNVAANIEMLKAAWEKVAPNQDFEKIFLDDSVAAQYSNELRTSRVVKIASTLSILIALIGLFGLITLTIAQRRKEIGIRKILGASITSVIRLLSLDFAKLILIAALVAIPLSWWFMADWLKDFAYRVDLKWWVFLISSGFVLVIALLVVSLQAIKAAVSNPVKSLRTE